MERTTTAPNWKITPDWQGETAFIIAGGSSVKNQNLNLLRGRRVLALNSSYEAAPWADILFFADRRWYYDHWKRPAFLAFAGRKVSCNANINAPGISKLRRIIPNLDPKHKIIGPGLASECDAVVSNRTCLQGGINILAHLGVRRIVLLGADACRAEDGETTHHHAPHKWRNKPGNATWDIQLTQLALTVEPLKALGIAVVNTSPISRIQWWPKMTLEESLTCAQSSIASCDPAELTDPPTLTGSKIKSETATLSP